MTADLVPVPSVLLERVAASGAIRPAHFATPGSRAWRQLLEDLRRLSARRLLAETDLDAGETAFLLGYPVRAPRVNDRRIDRCCGQARDARFYALESKIRALRISMHRFKGS